MADPTAHRPLRVFVGFADHDRQLKDELLTHLAVLEQVGRVELWNADQVRVGDDWRKGAEAAIVAADAALILISANFLAGAFANDTDMSRLLTRLNESGRPIIPVILRSCLWKEHPWIGALKQLPRTGEAIAAHEGDARDRAFADVAATILDRVIADRTKSDTKPLVPSSGQVRQPHAGLGRVGERSRGAPFFRGRGGRVAIAIFLVCLVGLGATAAFLTNRAQNDGRDTQCDPGRQLYDGVCLSGKMVDFLVCLQVNGATTALAQASEVVRAHGTNATGSSDVSLRVDIDHNLALLPDAELRIVMQFCREAAGAAHLHVPPPPLETSIPPEGIGVPSGFAFASLGERGTATFVQLDDQGVLPSQKVTVMSLWGPSCSPCIRQLPKLRALFGLHGDWNARVTFLPVIVDGETAAPTSEVKAQMPVFHHFLNAYDDSFTEALRRKGLWQHTIPVTFVIGCGQRIRWMRFGELMDDDIVHLESIVSDSIKDLDSAVCKKLR